MGGSLRRKIFIHQITGLCYRKTNAITTPFSNVLVILVDLFKAKERICEMIETFYGVWNLRAVILRSGLGHRGDVPISNNLMFMNKGK